MLALHFGDGSDATLATRLDSLVVNRVRADAPVACFFDNHSLIALGVVVVAAAVSGVAFSWKRYFKRP